MYSPGDTFVNSYSPASLDEVSATCTPPFSFRFAPGMLYDCPSGATVATTPRTAPVSAFMDCALRTLLNATIMKSNSSDDANVFRLGGRVITIAMPRHCHVQ